MDIQNPLKVKIKQYIQEKQKALTLEFLKINKVFLSQECKNLLFKYLEQKESSSELDSYIQLIKIVPKARPFIKKEFIGYFQGIKNIKINFIKELFQRSKIKYQGDISDQLISSIYKNSSIQIQTHLGKSLGPHKAKILSQRISNYLSTGIFIQELKLNGQTKSLILKYLGIVLSEKYLRERSDLEIVLQGILINDQNQLKQTISSVVPPQQYQQVEKQIMDLVKICKNKNWQQIQRLIQALNKQRRVQNKQQQILIDFLLNKLELSSKYFMEMEEINVIVQGMLKQDYESFRKIIEDSVGEQNIQQIEREIREEMGSYKNNKSKEVKDIQIIEKDKQIQQGKDLKYFSDNDTYQLIEQKVFIGSPQIIQQVKDNIPIEFSLGKLQSIQPQHSVISSKLPQFKQPSDDLRTSFNIQQSIMSQIPDTIPKDTQTFEKSLLNKKIYILIKLKDKISFPKTPGQSKISLFSSNKSITIKLNQITSLVKYTLLQFTLPKATKNETYFFKFTDQSKKQYQSNKLEGEDFDEQCNFILEQLSFNYRQSFPFTSSFEIQKSTMLEKLLMICILGKEKTLIQFLNWISNKNNIKSFLIDEDNDFQSDESLKFIKKYFKQKNRIKQNIIPYVLACIYSFKKQLHRQPKISYIQKYFLEQIQFNQIQTLPLLKEYQIILRKSVFEIYYIHVTHKNQFYKVSQLFNSLLRYSSTKDNLHFLMKIVYDARITNRTNRLANIDINKLKSTITELKNNILMLQYVYYILLCLVYMNSDKIRTFNYISQIVDELIQHKEINEQIIEKNNYTKVCRQLVNLIYGQDNFIFNDRIDDFTTFFLCCDKLPSKYKNIFVTSVLVQKTFTFIKSRMQIKTDESLEFVRVILQQCENLELLTQQRFQQIIIDFFYRNEVRQYTQWGIKKKQKFKLLQKLNNQLLELFVSQIIFLLYMKRKYSKSDKFRVLKQLIKQLNQFTFEEIFAILEKGMHRLNMMDRDHQDIIDYLFAQIMKNLIIKDPAFYQHIIQQKKWQFVFKLNPYSKQFLIDKIINQARWMDKYNKTQFSMIDIINDTVISDFNITEEQKDQIIEIIYDLKDENSIDIITIKLILFQRPHLALTYIRFLERGQLNQNIINKIKQMISIIKNQLQKKKVSYKNLKKVFEYNQQNWVKLQKLFDCVGNKTLKVIMQELYTQCQSFMAKLQMIAKLSKLFQFKLCKLTYISANNAYRTFIETDNNLDFQINQILMPFHKLKSEVSKYMSIRYFINSVLDKQPNDSTQFVTLLNYSVNIFIQNINKICSKYIKKQLKLNEFLEIISNQNQNDIKQLLKIHQDISNQHIQELLYVTEKISQLNEFSKIYDTLVALLIYYNQEGLDQILELRDIFDKYKKQKYHRIKVYDIYKSIKNFEKLLQTYQLKLDKEEQINKIIQLTKLSKPPQGIWSLLELISFQEIEDIKDYLNDQEQTFVNAKTISELQYVQKYYQTVVKSSKSFDEFLKKLNIFINENLHRQIQSLSNSILSSSTHHISLGKTYELSKHRQNSFKFIVVDFMEKSTIIIQHIEQSDEKELSIKIYNNNRSYTKKQLNEWRDKSLLLINAIQKQSIEGENKKQKQTDLTILKEFVSMYEKLEKMIENYKKLSYLGYFNNFVNDIANQQEKIFQLNHKNFQDIQQHNICVTKQYQIWEKQMDQAYAGSFGLCHFQGKQLKKIMRDIVNQKFPTILNKILPKINIQIFKNALKEYQFRENQINNPVKSLKLLSDLFKKLEILNGIEYPLNHSKFKYNNIKVEVKIVVIKESMNYYGLKFAIKNMKQSINMPQILLCRNTTNQYQIKTFLLRAIQDRKRPYFVIGTHNLTAKIQNNFCEFLKQSLEHQKLKHTVRYMNLYMIDNSTNEKIYSFIANNKEFKLIKLQDTFSSHECQTYYETQAGNFLIVESSAAGLGKTFYIQSEIKSKKLTPSYFPVAGNLQFNRLYQRISKLNLNEKSALVIQIHNIKNKKILDEFLFQIIFYKCLKNEGFLFLPQELHVYVQLQNVLNQKFFQQYQTLKIFKQNQKYIKTIKQVTLQDIKINHEDPKILFVIKYLQLLKDKQIQKFQITYQEFQMTYKMNNRLIIDDKFSRQLLNEYLLKPLIQKKNKPSYVQIQSFLSLLFQSLKTFASSYYYKIEQLNFYHKNFPSGNFNEYRHHYINILINNARDFLLRTINEKNFEENQAIAQKQQFNQLLKQFPFLIVSNGDQLGYSFIYKNDQKVDEIIKKYILVQQNKLNAHTINDSTRIKQLFKAKALNSMKLVDLKKQLLIILKQIAGLPPNVQIKQDQNYSITLDNFFKICLIIQRMRAKIPIIIMGETGVGKTALIRYLVQNIYRDELMLINIHAGINQNQLIKKIDQMKKRQQQTRKINKRLWVFFDEFNTTEEVGYIKEIIMQKRFLGEQLSQNFIFLAACNPFRIKQKKEKKNEIKVGIEKKVKNNPNQGMLYKVLPPPQSLIQCMWDFQQLKADQSKQYIYAILSTIPYRPNDISEVVHQTHQDFKREIEKSAVNLRDVSRFKILYQWFMKNMPMKPVHHQQQKHSIDYYYNYEQIKRQERAFILSICFCYYMRLETTQKRKKYLQKVQKSMKYPRNYMATVLENQQIDYLSRMEKPKGTALNLALRENVFTSFVCLMNKLPIIIVGMPGCSKSLAISLLLSNLRGKNSDQDFFKNLPEIQMFQFQGSESCSSQGVQQVFERAYRLLKDFKDNNNIIPCILFDEIGLAELSVHNPLKVLHSHLQVNHTKASFIGISNWQLDASKMARFLIVSRPIPDSNDLCDTAIKILQSQDTRLVHTLNTEIKALSTTYYKFTQEWKKKQDNDFPDFFGLRDFYSLIKYIVFRLKNGINQGQELDIIKRSVQRNFDGRSDSIKMFLTILRQQIANQIIATDDQTNILQLISQNLSDKQSRCLLQIIKGQALIYILNQQQIKFNNKNIITIHGSTFQQDRISEEYNLVVISDIINYVSQGYVIILKDVPNNIQTSLYDLLNKSFQRVGQKNYARIAVGANYNPKCFVHDEFNCIVYIMQNLLKEVDPPFLNRFQKHYLVIDKFITHYESRIIEALRDWINQLLSPVLTKQNPLLKQHYIINVCDESLASLAIKQIYALTSNQQKQLQLQSIIQNCKKTLMMNSTTDFNLLIRNDKNLDKKNKQFIDKCLEERKQYIAKGIYQQQRLIIYTYDKNTEIYEENILYEKDKTKVIKICEIRCQKQLRSEIQIFYKQKYTNLQIKLNYQKEHNHLCLIIFLIDTIAKRFNNPTHKRIYIILMISRLTLLIDGKKHKQISYLNGYKEIFIERLELGATACYQILMQGNLQKISKIFNFQQLILRLFFDCTIRFDFKYTNNQQQKQNLLKFNEILSKMSENKIFLKYCAKFIQGKFIQPNPKNWQKEVLIDRQIALSSHTTYDAIIKYFSIRIEDFLANYIYFVVQNQVAYCFDYETSVQILQKYIPNSKTYLLSLFEQCKQSYEIILDTLFDKLSPKPHNQLKKLSKGAGEVKIVLSYPKLFPFINKQRIYILKKERNLAQDKQNQMKIEQTLEDICEKISEFEQKLNSQKNQQSKPLLQSKLKQAKDMIMKKTNLVSYSIQGQKEYDYIENINSIEKWKNLKSLFLFDIKNIFLINTLQVNISLSLQFNQLISYFTLPETDLIQQLMIILRGNQFWQKFLSVQKVFKQLNKKCYMLFQNYKSHIIQDKLLEFFKHKIYFIKQFIKNCQIYLLPSQKNISQNYGGFKNYQIIFNNVYYILEGLQNQYKQLEIIVSEKIRLMKNFIKTLQNIDQENESQLCNNFLKIKEDNLYIKIDEFLEDIKKVKKYENKLEFILKYQAGYLYRYWMQHINNYKIIDSEAQNFISKFINLVNKEKHFAHSCSYVIWKLFIGFQFQDEPISNIINSLSSDQINKNLFFSAIEKNIIQGKYQNHLSVVLIDFICKLIPEPELEYEIQDNNQHNQYCLKKMYDSVKDVLTLEIEKMNGLQNILFLALMRNYLIYYVECLVLDNLKNKIGLMEDIDTILSRSQKVFENLRIYCLKLLRKKIGFKQIKNQYISINRANWIKKNENEFSQIQSKQFITPYIGEVNHQMNKCIEKFIQSNYKEMKYLEQMFEFKGYNERYRLFSFFMTDIYSFICKQSKRLIIDFLNKQHPNLEYFELDLLRRYASSKITQKIFFNEQMQIQVLQDQVWILNNINYLVSIRCTQSPLTSIFFTTQGKIPQSFSEHTNQQFILCGKDNPYRSIMQSTIFSIITRNVGVYICSNKCDFVYCLEGCGWPSEKSKCRFCDNEIAGVSHQLIRVNQGARRIGPNLLYLQGRFQYSYDAINTQYQPLFIWGQNQSSLQTVDYYWKWLKIYIQMEIQRIIQKKIVIIQEKKLDEQKKVITNPVSYKLTGFMKYTNETQSRMHQFTNNILGFTLNSLLYFFIQFGWIKQQQCPKSFEGRSKSEMIDFTLNGIKTQANKLKQTLDTSEWRSWLMGMQKLIFETAINYKIEVEQYIKKKIEENNVERIKIEQASKILIQQSHKQLFQNVINQGVIFSLPKVQIFTAHKCWNRDLFQKIIENNIKANCSGQDKVNFIKNFKTQKGELVYTFDNILTQQDSTEIIKYPYLKILRVAQNPSYAHMIKEYSMKINSEYPLLDYLLNNRQKLQKIESFYYVVNFVNQISQYVKNRFSRQIAKATPIQDFINNLKIDIEIKKQLEKLLNKFIISWNKLANKLGVIQYQCKILGTMSQYTIKTPLIAFLIDSLDNSNYYGKILNCVFHLFAVEQNSFINHIEAKKYMIPHLKDVQLFTQNQYLPQKIYEKDIIKISQHQLQALVASLSSSSVQYGNGIPMYNFEVLQYKLTTELYGKKRIVSDMKQYVNIQFAGEMFNRMGQYSNYITEVRDVGGNRPLPDLDQIRGKFITIKNRNENNYFITIKAIQGYLQKIMIFFKTLQPKNMSLKDYIEKYKFKNCPEELIQKPFRDLPVQCIVNLYEQIQLSIINKTWEILPEIYRQQELTEEQKIEFKNFLNKAKNKKENDMIPSFEEFKVALYRLTSRCLVLAEIPNDKLLMEFLPYRADFWPYDFKEQIRENIQQHINCSIELRKIFSLYNLLTKFIDPFENKKYENKKYENQDLGEKFEIKKEKSSEHQKIKRKAKVFMVNS